MEIGRDKMEDTHNNTICYEAHGNLYLNITNRCSADCTFCVRNFQTGVYGYDLRLSRDPSLEEIIAELEKHDISEYGEIVFTGFGEPTLRFEVLLKITGWLKSKEAYIRLDTNGHAQLINPENDVIENLKDAGLDAVSVSLNAESKEKYDRICKPAYPDAYQAMLDFTKNARNAGIDTRMTVVRIPEIDIDKCREIATSIRADFHVRG
ncbi:TatD family-associated radical SAM protein [Methanohalophilus levihalophilus]|uniref:TatD family nuclease-associated radical SAM protein n=1 Tax=Methanohalophilus levihalophilus TaxID=1431282 RepID=UPI001FD9E023|nr:TatD family nuclease-associated radical SAM protein [Methanohalophilus levihalophilus]MBP2029694.1 TatD family-associated radical SAM protein [Methanohalophilus levihalophilus]